MSGLFFYWASPHIKIEVNFYMGPALSGSTTFGASHALCALTVPDAWFAASLPDISVVLPRHYVLYEISVHKLYYN